MTKYNYRRAWSKIRSLNLRIGFLVALAFVFFAFQLTVEEKDVIIPEGPVWEDPEVTYNPRSLQQERVLPPPEKVIEKKPTIEIPQEFIIDETIDETTVEEFTSQEDDFLDELPIVETVKQESTPIIVPEEPEEDEIMIFTDHMPVFGEDCKALTNEEERRLCSQKEVMRFISSRVKYSDMARESGLSGKVTAKFVIDKDGDVIDIEILRGVNALLDKEVVRVLNQFPTWEPGKQDFQPVKVQMIIPVVFELN